MNPADRRSGHYNPELETMRSEDREQYLSRRLGEIARHAWENAPAMRDKFERAGARPDDIGSVADLEKLPLTKKSELVELQKKDPPFGGLAAVCSSEPRRSFAPPGLVSEPYELHYEDDRWRQAFFAAGFRPGDVGQVAFDCRMVPFAMMLDDSLTRLGCLSLPTGIGSTELQVGLMKELAVNAYVGAPGFLKALADKAEEMGLDLKNDLSLETAFVVGEMLPESLRRELEGRLEMIVRQGYGTADAGCLGYECCHKNGMHWSDNVIVEVIDPMTGRRAGPGEVGEVAATVLNKAYPLIRFGTGDLSCYADEPCPCGRTSNRLLRMVGRVDEVARVRGVFIHPGQADEVASRFGAVRGCRIVVARAGHEDKVTFQAEVGDDVTDREALQAAVEAALRDVLRLKGECVFVRPGELPGDGGKIEDRRTRD